MFLGGRPWTVLTVALRGPAAVRRAPRLSPGGPGRWHGIMAAECGRSGFQAARPGLLTRRPGTTRRVAGPDQLVPGRGRAPGALTVTVTVRLAPAEPGRARGARAAGSGPGGRAAP
eukprot:747593-Hanusia_phi.AAC.2